MPQLPSCLLLLLPLLLWSGAARSQVALRAEPLITGPLGPGAGRGGGGAGPGVQWPRRDPGNSTNIESSLAAIFRGVAYGLPPVPTLPPTSTTPPTPPPPPPPPPALPPRLPENEWAKFDDELFGENGLIVGGPETPPTVEVMRAGSGTGVVWVGQLGQAWVVHVYCTGGMFTVVGVAGVVGAARVRVAVSLLPRPHYLSLHLLMVVAAVARCVHLFLDPYGTSAMLPQGVAMVAEEVAWPCLTAALAVVLLGVVGAWRRNPHPHPHAHHAPLTLAAITVFHLALAVTTHALALNHPAHAGPLRAAAQTATAAWGGVVGVGGVAGAGRVVQGLSHPTACLGTTPARPALLHGARLALAAAITQISVAGLHLYSLLGPPDALHVPPLHPWHWLAVEAARGGLQVVAWLLLALAALRPFSPNHHTYRPAPRPTSHPAKTEARLWRGLWVELWRGRCGSVGGDSAHTHVLPTPPRHRQEDRSHSLTAHAHSRLPCPPMLPCFPTPPHRAASDVHLQWSHARARDAPTSGCSSRPPSLVVSDTGLARLAAPPSPPHFTSSPAHRTHDTHHAQEDPEEGPNAYDQHLYYNAVAPVPRKPTSPSGHTSPKAEVEVKVQSWGVSTSPCSTPSPISSCEPRHYEDSDGAEYQLPYASHAPPPPTSHCPRHPPTPPLSSDSQRVRSPPPGTHTCPGPTPHPRHTPRPVHGSQPDLLPHSSSPPPLQAPGWWVGQARPPQGSPRPRYCEDKQEAGRPAGEAIRGGQTTFGALKPTRGGEGRTGRGRTWEEPGQARPLEHPNRGQTRPCTHCSHRPQEAPAPPISATPGPSKPLAPAQCKPFNPSHTKPHAPAPPTHAPPHLPNHALPQLPSHAPPRLPANAPPDLPTHAPPKLPTHTPPPPPTHHPPPHHLPPMTDGATQTDVGTSLPSDHTQASHPQPAPSAPPAPPDAAL